MRETAENPTIVLYVPLTKKMYSQVDRPFVPIQFQVIS